MYKRNPVFFAACMGMLLFGISLITLGSVATDLRSRFDLDGISSGTVFSILPVGILAGSFLFGPFCDRYGYKLLLILACMVMFAGFEGIALAPSLTILKLCILIFGLGAGVINGATNAVVADISVKHKGANLSLLGVFFCLGALGMPLLLGVLANSFHSFQVIAGVGWLTLAVGLLYVFIQFPPAKQQTGIAGAEWKGLFNSLLILIAFFLFFQSSLEAIVNNWTTTFLISRSIMTESYALYALSLHIAGMTLMRLLSGSVFRKVSPASMLWASFSLLLTGFLFMQYGHTPAFAIAGLVLTGAGLAEGFPVMLGYVGERFVSLSATAFSFVFVVALIGNMLINYLVGWVIHHYGVDHLITVSFVEVAIMILLFVLIINRLHTKKIV